MDKYLFGEAEYNRKLQEKIAKGGNVTTKELNDANKAVFNKMIEVGNIGVFVAEKQP